MSSNARISRATPGVYITELPAFPNAIVGVATAVPIFIGYTATAADHSSGKPLYMQAISITSMADYVNYFGGPFYAQGAVMAGIAAVPAGHDFQAQSITVDGKAIASATNNYLVSTSCSSCNSTTGDDALPLFKLYAAMQLFFANGGGNCFVISVANYWGSTSITAPTGATATTISSDVLLAGLAVANTTSGATMLVIPDACMLPPAIVGTTVSYARYGEVVCAMMQQAATLRDRVAIIDLPGALDRAFWSPAGMITQAGYFFDAIAPAAASFSYGAAYGPALESSLLEASDIDYGNLAGTPASQTLMNNLLTSQALSLHPANTDGTYAAAFIAIAARIAAAYPVAGTVIAFGTSTGVIGTVVSSGTVASSGTPAVKLLVSVAAKGICAPPTDDAGRQMLDEYLRNATPLLAQVQQILASQLNVVPPSGVLAGVWSQNDAHRGVWNAPANISLNQIISPRVLLNDAQQGEFNLPRNGNAIDILRAFPGRGTVVWGARTLDGNSFDYRYIQVRRSVNHIEQSIKVALQQFVFAPNDGVTWATVTASISSFLTQLWQEGALMGDKASDGFKVACGVPGTMSGREVLDGYMIVNVSVSLIHPAEFINLTFSQTMQGS